MHLYYIGKRNTMNCSSKTHEANRYARNGGSSSVLLNTSHPFDESRKQFGVYVAAKDEVRNVSLLNSNGERTSIFSVPTELASQLDSELFNYAQRVASSKYKSYSVYNIYQDDHNKLRGNIVFFENEKDGYYVLPEQNIIKEHPIKDEINRIKGNISKDSIVADLQQMIDVYPMDEENVRFLTKDFPNLNETVKTNDGYSLHVYHDYLCHGRYGDFQTQTPQGILMTVYYSDDNLHDSRFNQASVSLKRGCNVNDAIKSLAKEASEKCAHRNSHELNANEIKEILSDPNGVKIHRMTNEHAIKCNDCGYVFVNDSSD